MASPPVIVFDNGSGYLKAGFSNNDSPMVTVPAKNRKCRIKTFNDRR